MKLPMVFTPSMRLIQVGITTEELRGLWGQVKEKLPKSQAD